MKRKKNKHGHEFEDIAMSSKRHTENKHKKKLGDRLLNNTSVAEKSLEKRKKKKTRSQKMSYKDL